MFWNTSIVFCLLLWIWQKTKQIKANLIWHLFLEKNCTPLPHTQFISIMFIKVIYIYEIFYLFIFLHMCQLSMDFLSFLESSLSLKFQEKIKRQSYSTCLMNMLFSFLYHVKYFQINISGLTKWFFLSIWCLI